MPNLGSGSLLVKIWQCYNGAQSVSEVTLALGSASVALVHGLAPATLGLDSTLTKEKLQGYVVQQGV